MKKSISLTLILLMFLTSGLTLGVTAAGGGGGVPGIPGSTVTIEDFYEAVESLRIDSDIYGSAVDIDTDIKVSVNDGAYTDEHSQYAASSTTHDLKFKATVKMDGVREKFEDYIRYSEPILALDPAFEGFLNDVNIIGAIQIDIVFPKDLADEINSDIANGTGTGYDLVFPATDMEGFTLENTNGVNVKEVYSEINPTTGVRERIWTEYTDFNPEAESHGEGEWHLLITVYPKSPLSPVGDNYPLSVGDLKSGVGAPDYAPYDYNTYLGDLVLEFDEHIDLPHEGITTGTVYGNVAGYTEYVMADSSTHEITVLSETKYSAVQEDGYEDELSIVHPEHEECPVKSKQITATYEFEDADYKKIIFHVDGTFLVPPAVKNTDYTAVIAPVYGVDEVEFDVSEYRNIPGKRSKYSLVGWSTSPDGDVIIADTTFTDDVTHLYAIFKERAGGTTEPIYIHYVIDGKIDAIPFDKGYAPLKVDLRKLDVPEMSGFKFDGWYEDGTYRNKVSDIYSTSVSTSLFGRYVKADAPEVLESDDHFAYIIGYPEGDVRPLNNITREEIAVIFYRLLKDEVREDLADTSNDFSDVDSARWSNKAISTMENGGYITGYEDGTFRPGNFITRAEFATIAARFLDKDYATELVFSDISGHWAEKYIESVATSHWVNGYEDGTFRPDRYITRAEAITIINRILVRYVNGEGIHADARQWPDNTVDAWYYYDMLEATSSHYYYRLNDGVHEKWTDLKPNKVWDN